MDNYLKKILDGIYIMEETLSLLQFCLFYIFKMRLKMKKEHNIKIIKKDYISDVIEIENSCFSFSDKNDYSYFVKDFARIDSIYVGALYQNKLIGYLNFKIHNEIQQAHFTSIAVLKEYRRFGIAEQLNQFAYKYLKKNNIKTIRLEVRRSNFKSRKLCEKDDFIYQGIRKNYFTNPEEDAILYIKRL